MTSNSTSIVYVSMGSNIEPETNLKRAIELLEERGTITAVSHAYRTPPQGFSDQAEFLNLALCMTTSLEPETLKHTVLDWIEQELKRVRDPKNKNAPRTIDLDISLWNEEVFEYGEKPWRVPDPDILRFAHVVLPLAEVAPAYLHPIEKITLSEIASRFEDTHFETIRLI